MYNSDIHKRKSIRLKGYDYSQEGLYFVTICTHNKECLFGDVIGGDMVLNDAGVMVEKLYLELINENVGLKTHEYIIMPNHFHCVIEIRNVGVESISTQKSNVDFLRADIESAPTHNKINIPTFIQSFKRFTTIKYIKMVRLNILPPFDKKTWQRNYYEHIIRNEKSHIKIAEYIKSNPLKWIDDKYYIENHKH